MLTTLLVVVGLVGVVSGLWWLSRGAVVGTLFGYQGLEAGMRLLVEALSRK